MEISVSVRYIIRYSSRHSLYKSLLQDEFKSAKSQDLWFIFMNMGLKVNQQGRKM